MDFELMIHRQAEIDLEEIVVYYNKIRENLRFEVYEEIYSYIQEIKSRPFSFRKEIEHAGLLYQKISLWYLFSYCRRIVKNLDYRSYKC